MIDGHAAGWQSRKVTLAPINAGEDGRRQSNRERPKAESDG